MKDADFTPTERKLEVECLCYETFDTHVCYHECPKAFKYKGLSSIIYWQ